MKELKLFESWADSISKSYVTEFVAPDKKKNSRAMNSSIQSIAQRQYPDLSPEEALITYMGQKLADMEAKDAEQIKLINRQSQETNKLMNTVQGIRAAYDDLERSSQEVEQEIEQIRGGAERVKSGQEQSTISAREVQELLRTVEELKKNPSVDKSEYAELVNSVKGLKDSNVSKEQYEELKQQIEQAHNEQAPELGEIHADIERLKQEYGEKVKNIGSTRDEIADQMQKLQSISDDAVNNLTQLKQEMSKLGFDLDNPDALHNWSSLINFMRNGYPGSDGKLTFRELIATIADHKKAIENRIPTTKEIQKLENLPDEEELTKLKTISPKIQDIENQLLANNDLDNQQNKKIEQFSSMFGYVTGIYDGREQEIEQLAKYVLQINTALKKIYGDSVPELDPNSFDPRAFISSIQKHRQTVSDFSREQRRKRQSDPEIQKRSLARRQSIADKKENGISNSKNLPESYLNAIDTMAENILGEQYGKYLK